jgi:1,4-alpha-glucan branching enzyme
MQFSKTSRSEEIARIVKFEESRPNSILGPKLTKLREKDVLSIRAYLPRAKKAWVEFSPERKQEMVKVDKRGFYETQLKADESSRYVISFTDETGFTDTREDPYSFPPFLSDYDIYLIGEGTHRRSYEKLGAHAMERNGTSGVQFAVWAPNARSASVIGNFNHWNIGEHPMDSRGLSGIWELFVPRLGSDEVYKFAIKSNADGNVLAKTDPYAFRTELRPRTAAVVEDLEKYEWHDQNWLDSGRSKTETPMSIYEVHLGSWKRGDQNNFLSYREIADDLVPYAKGMGFTHLEFLPVMEHPLDDSWGYQVVNYFAPTSRFGSPLDFMYLVDKCHQNGMGIILDWVPAHFPKDDYGLAFFDGTHLYEHSDPKMGEHPEWGTLIFNYDRKEVRTFLISNAIFWFDKYHIDGLRLDAVSSMLYLDYARKPGEWVPNKFGGRENLAAMSFLKELNSTVHSMYPFRITVAEESTAWPGVTQSPESGGLGFDFKWNMGWMHDTLNYFSEDPIYRKHRQGNLTFSLLYAFSEKFILVLSHDEVVYGKRSLFSKMPGDDWQKFANLRLLLGYMFTHPGKKLLFMGSELGQRSEWNFRTGLDWYLASKPMNSSLQLYVHDLNKMYGAENSLHELDFTSDGFEWIDFRDVDQSVISYMRKTKSGDSTIVVCNMTPVPRLNYRVGVPIDGWYKEILNSDAKEYGGGGVGNLGGVKSESVNWNSKPYSLKIALPPLGILVFKLRH